MTTNPVQIQYAGMRPAVEDAVSKANALLRTEHFYEQIRKFAVFDMADISPAKITDLMRNAGITVNVDLYYALSPVKNIDGFDDLEDPLTLHMNIWKLNRSVASICNSLVHGCVHAVNARYSQYYFGHGDRTLEGKQHTAPYKIGNIAQMLIAHGDTQFIQLEHDTICAEERIIKDYLPV